MIETGRGSSLELEAPHPVGIGRRYGPQRVGDALGKPRLPLHGTHDARFKRRARRVSRAARAEEV